MKSYKPNLLKIACFSNLVFLAASQSTFAADMTKNSAHKPNVIVIYADDISAREFAIYGSSKWSDKRGKSVSDPKHLAEIPVLTQIAKDGAFIENAWAATVCSPSRAMMMTGRYASLHKWWHNSDYGRILKKGSKQTFTPKKTGGKNSGPKKRGKLASLFETSNFQIGHLAQKAGYATMWTGKTQMKSAVHDQYGFDEGVFTPGNMPWEPNGLTDFNVVLDKKTKKLINTDSGKPLKTKYYPQSGWYWKPNVYLMNHPDAKSKGEYWPNTPESKASFGVNTFGPDVELDFIFDFMDRQHAKDKPFFVYHTTHLGHDGYDFLNPDNPGKWPGTPVVNWDGEKYTRVQPNITGSDGVYNTHGTVTEPTIANHVKYLDYQVWLYLEKLKKMGIENDTILIFAADNGTSGYGKASHKKQEGTHVPLVVYAPGIKMTKQGKQPVLASMADILPTLGDIMGVEIPQGYEIHGESIWPFLTTDKKDHREWIYAYKSHMQLIRGNKVMKDGADKWWDVSQTPDDLTSFKEIKDWSKVSQAHRNERDKLKKVLPRFDNYQTEHDFIPKK